MKFQSLDPKYLFFIEALREIGRWLIPFTTRRWLLQPMIAPREYREEIAVAESMLVMRHERKGLDDEYWASNLRKYAHILDKGLQRYDCEPGHSDTFYLNALVCIDMINGEEMLRDPSVLWAMKKVADYKRLQKECTSITKREPFIPTKCSYDDLADVIKSRRSIRSFAERTIAREVIEKIAGVANWAPSSCNRQTVKVFIADSRELIQTCMEANSGATCFGTEIPCFMSFCADLRVYDMPKEMTLPILDVSLGMQNCCLVAHSLGIGMTLLNWTHRDKLQDKQLREALSIPPHYRIIANAVLGYPEQGAPLPARKEASLTYAFIKGQK